MIKKTEKWQFFIALYCFYHPFQYKRINLLVCIKMDDKYNIKPPYIIFLLYQPSFMYRYYLDRGETLLYQQKGMINLSFF